MSALVAKRWQYHKEANCDNIDEFERVEEVWTCIGADGEEEDDDEVVEDVLRKIVEEALSSLSAEQ
jgi:hypothetical protein